MLLFASVILTLSLQFDAEHVPDTEVQLVQTADSSLWYPLNQGFTRDQPFGLAVTPSSGQELRFALREYNANCIHNGVIALPQSLAKAPFTDIDATFSFTQNTCAYAALTTPEQPSVTVTASIGKVPFSGVKEAIATAAPSGRTLRDAPWQPQPPQHEPTVYGWSRINSKGQIEAHYSSAADIAVPAYSLSKTFIAATAALLYRKQHDAKVLQQSLQAWGNVCPQESWQNVTLADALNMRTGHYTSSTHRRDEAATEMIENFFEAATHEAKLNHACSYPQQGQQTVVYQTSATYLAASALEQALSEKHLAGLDHYLYQFVWQPLKLSPLAYSIDSTKDKRQQVWGGYGLTLLPRDLVKLAHFVQHDPLQLGFKEVLAAPESAYSIPAQQNLRYRQSIWFWQHPETEKWYPFLSGYGGIIVLFLDDQHIYYMVSDQHDHRFKSVVDDFEQHQQKSG